jgi:hypothetical protein
VGIERAGCAAIPVDVYRVRRISANPLSTPEGGQGTGFGHSSYFIYSTNYSKIVYDNDWVIFS